MYRGQPPKSSTRDVDGLRARDGRVLRVGQPEGAVAAARRPRARAPTIESRSGRFIVGVTSSTWSTSGRTSASGVPGSSPSGRSMIPEWSGPSPTSSSARIIPRDTSPRSGRSSSGPGKPGRSAPGRPTATVAPAPKFHAPQTICCGSGLPTSTWQSWSRSAFGCGSAASTRPTTKWPRLPPSSATPTSITRSTSSDGDREPPRDLVRGRRRLDVLAQPGERDAHQNCLEKRRSLRQSSRRSGNSWRSMAMRSRPQPEREARVALGVVADELEELRVDHPRAAELDPARVPADRAARAVADVAGDVRLDRRLGEREVVRAELRPPLLAEQRLHQQVERPEQVGERDPLVDREPLDLVEDRRVRRVGRVAAVHAAERDDVDRAAAAPPSSGSATATSPCGAASRRRGRASPAASARGGRAGS